MLERDYQKGLVKRIKDMMPPGTRVIKNDAQLKQGIQDLLVSYGDRCAWLEVKKSKNAKHQPNQDFYVDLVNSQGGFARFIYPENEEEVLSEMMEEVFHDLV